MDVQAKLTEVSGHRLKLPGIARRNDDGRAGFGQSVDDIPAVETGSSGNENDLSLQ
jgi:hypothetical protein